MRVLSAEYATFRDDVQTYFIKNVLPQHRSLLDPMAGTSPLVPYFETHGHTAHLNDISPVHFYVNRAKQYQIYQCHRDRGYKWFLNAFLDCMGHLRKFSRRRTPHRWIDDEVLCRLTEAWERTEAYEKNISTYLKALIVMSVRSFSSCTRSGNPTWFKAGGGVPARDIRETASASIGILDKYYDISYGSRAVGEKGRCRFSIQNAASLRLQQKVEVIITSPQYCNRLDTVRQYGPELYFLSAVGHPISGSDVIGTNQVKDYKSLESDLEYLTTRSKYANRLLGRIKKYPKKKAPQYYLKYYTRYFAALSRAICKTSHNLLPGGKMYIVVQDNTHRGQDIEIDQVLREVLAVDGWRCRVYIVGERTHLGLRNPSPDHAYVKRRQLEKIMVLRR